jgi:formylglycine-generating enzyme required for sulfatase activity
VADQIGIEEIAQPLLAFHGKYQDAIRGKNQIFDRKPLYANVPGAELIGCIRKHYPEEAPAHWVTVSSFWIDPTPVTNREFCRFVEATGYVTVAEIAPNSSDYPGALPHAEAGVDRLHASPTPCRSRKLGTVVEI